MEFTDLTMFPTTLKQPVRQTVKRPFEDSVTVPARWHYLAGLGQGSLRGCICSESVSKAWCRLSPTARVHRSRNRGVEMIVAPHTITPSDPPAKYRFLSPRPHVLLVPKRGILPPGNTTRIPLNQKVRLPPSQFGLLVPRNQQGEKEAPAPAGGLILTSRGEWAVLHSGGQEERVLRADSGEP